MSTRATQSHILKVALELFNAHGTGAVSVHRIATQACVSRSHLHYHFPGKQEIVLSLFQQLAMRMDEDWYEDHLHPSIDHMALMYLRHFQLILEYRFLYRELSALLKDDALLALRYNQNRTKRTAEIARFFRALAARGEFRGRDDQIDAIVAATWILCDGWPNYLEIQGREPTVETILEGYAAVLAVLGPYLTGSSEHALDRARAIIESSQQDIAIPIRSEH